MNRGVDRGAIFRCDRDRRDWLALLRKAAEATRVQVVVYCQMGNHFHLLVRCPHGGLSDMMQLHGSAYVQRFNHRHGRDGPLMRGRFTSKLVVDERYLAYLPVMSMLLAAWIVFRLANIEERPSFVTEQQAEAPRRKAKPRMAQVAAERRRANAGQR